MTNKQTYSELKKLQNVSKKQYYVCFRSFLVAQLSIHKLFVVFNHLLLFWQNSQTSFYNHSLQYNSTQSQSHLINNFFSVSPLPVCSRLARCQIYIAMTNTIGWISHAVSTSAGNTFCIHYFFIYIGRSSKKILSQVTGTYQYSQHILSAVRVSSSASHTLLFK